jgi:NADPH-dependent 2,4-dienoyl-CoA reductase/sulfur reductase-like enzyme
LSVERELAVDVAVVGGGPAGIAAACRAAESGASVALLDEGTAAGGQIWRGGRASSPGARRWLARLARSGARAIPRAVVADADPAGTLWAEVDGRPLAVAWRRLVVATGARERFLPFPGWTLGDVLGVGAAQALLKSGWEVRGRTVAVAGTGPLLLPVAALLAARGARVALVAEQTPGEALRRFARGLWRRPGKLLAAARLRAGSLAAPYRAGAWVTAAHGDGRVEEVAWTDGSRTHRTRCDLLCCAYGLVPNVELPRLLGCRLGERMGGGFVAVDGDQATSVPGVYCAGEPTGIAGVEPALAEGEIAGLAAAGGAIGRPLRRRRDGGRAWGEALAAAFALRPELLALARPETVVCRCEDVRLGDLDPDWTPRQAKLASRAGMGPCQGRVCGPALAALLGRAGWDDGAVRPPLKPVSVATLAAGSGRPSEGPSATPISP